MFKRIVALIDFVLFWYIVRIILVMFDANECVVEFFGQFIFKSWIFVLIGIVILVNFVLIALEILRNPKINNQEEKK